MKRVAVISLLAMIATPVAAEELSDRLAASRAAIQEFAQSLQGELQAAMQAGGPPQAIQVCSERAPEIADSISQKHGLAISRTSLKIRNPANSPDAWEREVLESFDARRAAGENPAHIEKQAVYIRGDQKEYRFMKAIPTGEVCLNCHGAQVAPPVEGALKRLYPDDAARGYNVGDLRGAFVVRKAMD
ncbi:hypothetical protein B1C78_08610 [Thioalkalivibrio denitrificans]|uniref:Tll0287-like domain-containing protein n=1 Tax=Thioalkalivibrio denitrificans TaxID=108003 RepID=A0A1V3NHU0_9GAMM|nr:DUF3365 domain-containing protein [Thioalkalivibrio denitrificans]OOG24554.1 hypothetical protein B1C78_08610 [Thioalkalivibrio denitrificans]